MKKSTKPGQVVIESSDPEAARRRGAKRLGLSPDDVATKPSGKSKDTASPHKLPNHLTIAISDDKMSAVIKEIAPRAGSAEGITAEEVERALADQKVIFGIRKEAIGKTIAEVSTTGKPQENILVAEGQPVVNGQDAQIELKVGPNAANKDPIAQFFVKAGQVIAVKKFATQGQPGINVLGEEINAKSGLGRNFEPGKNVAVSLDDTEFTATIYGRAKLSGSKISVEVPLQISRDKMSAQMEISPALSDNMALMLDDVLETLGHSGVVHGIKKDIIEAALKEGAPVQIVEVAEGTPAKNGVNAEVDFRFSLNNKDPESVDVERREKEIDEDGIIKEIVCEGDVLAVKKPLSPPRNGRDVSGKELSGKDPHDKTISIGPNVKLMDDGVTYIVDDGATGYANLVNGSLRVEDLIRVAKDKIAVHMCVYPSSISGRRLDKDLVMKCLNDHGITHGIQVKAIEKALKKAAAMTEPTYDVLIAKGNPPQKGKDAQYKFKFLPEKIAGKALEGTDRIDFKERAAIQTAKEGDVLAEKIQATPGKAGFDVFGDILSAIPGRDKMLKPADNVKVSDCGLIFTAESEGMISLFGGDKIGVFKVKEISGDVDYSTGNLNMDGSVIISGWVRPGFVVRASGDIYIGNGIENAVVDAGARVEVHGGIVGGDTGSVTAGGDILAQFIENSNVRAGGDIIVRDSVSRSLASADGRIDVATGKGHIMSGKVLAVKGVKAHEIGSRGGVKTLIDIGMSRKVRKLSANNVKQLSHLQRKKTKLAFILSKVAKKNIKGGGTHQKSRKETQLIKIRRETVKKEAELIKYRRLLAKKSTQSETKPVRVEVKKMVHEGTIVTIKGYTLSVEKDIKGSGNFILNMEKQKVDFIK